MNKSRIDWPWKPLWTWNPISGCFHSCRKTYCYNTMKKDSVMNRYGIRYRYGNSFERTKDWKSRERNYPVVALKGEIYPYGFTPTFYSHRLDEPIKKKKPLNIFTVDVGDMFGDWVPKNWIDLILNTVKLCPQHTFLFLTKNPKRYAEFEFPENCWLGATITNKKDLVKMYSNSKAKLDFLSIEPLLDSFNGIIFTNWKLIIVGAQTGPGAVIPKREWIESIKHPHIYYKDSIRKLYPEFENETTKEQK